MFNKFALFQSELRIYFYWLCPKVAWCSVIARNEMTKQSLAFLIGNNFTPSYVHNSEVKMRLLHFVRNNGEKWHSSLRSLIMTIYQAFLKQS